MKEWIVKDSLNNKYVQELVRCKDCKYGKQMCQPCNDIVCTLNGAPHYPVWFCADGEKAVKLND